MRGLIGSTCVAAAVLVPQPALAAPFQYHCQAALGQDPTISVAQSGPNFRVRGEIDTVRLARWPYPPGPVMMQDNQIPPTTRGARIGINSADDGNQVSLGVWADSGVQDRVEVSIGFSQDTDSADDVVNGRREVMTVPIGDLGAVSLPFEISADATGVNVEIAGRRMRFDVAIGMNGEISASCTGGEFYFSGLDWDR